MPAWCYDSKPCFKNGRSNPWNHGNTITNSGTYFPTSSNFWLRNKTCFYAAKLPYRPVIEPLYYPRIKIPANLTTNIKSTEPRISLHKWPRSHPAFWQSSYSEAYSRHISRHVFYAPAVVAAALVLIRSGTWDSVIIGTIDGRKRKKSLLPPARDRSLNLCRDLRERLVGLRMRRVIGLRRTLSAYLGSRFAEMRGAFEV